MKKVSEFVSIIWKPWSRLGRNTMKTKEINVKEV